MDKFKTFELFEGVKDKHHSPLKTHTKQVNISVLPRMDTAPRNLMGQFDENKEEEEPQKLNESVINELDTQDQIFLRFEYNLTTKKQVSKVQPPHKNSILS